MRLCPAAVQQLGETDRCLATANPRRHVNANKATIYWTLYQFLSFNQLSIVDHSRTGIKVQYSMSCTIYPMVVRYGFSVTLLWANSYHTMIRGIYIYIYNHLLFVCCCLNFHIHSILLLDWLMDVLLTWKDTNIVCTTRTMSISMHRWRWRPFGPIFK